MNISITQRMSGRTISMISLIALLIFLPLLLLAAYETATIISRAAGKPADISVDVNQMTGETINPEFMHAFAQGGEEANDWITPIQQEVSLLKPRWVRIDHLYDFYHIVKREDDRLVFDFSRVDRIIGAIRAVGAVPLISLSYMPDVIARDGVITNPPVNWDDWSEVVQKTIEHFSGPTGLNIADIYYEVWNEPDHPQFGGWKLTGDKNYLTLYEYAAKGASQAQGTGRFFLGGPGTTGLYKNWIMALAEMGRRLDFFSWHTYTDNPERFAQDQQNSTAWLLRYPEAVLLPRFITEFGLSGSKDPRYGTQFAVAYTAAVFRQMAPASPKGLFTFELKDGPNQKSGDGWGLIGHESLGKPLKPRFHVFSYLDWMEGSRLTVAGEGTWVTALATKQGLRFNILLVNYDASGNHVETVPVRVVGLPNGSYEYTQRYVDDKPKESGKTQVETVTDGTLTKQIHMPAQSVVLIELTPSTRRSSLHGQAQEAR